MKTTSSPGGSETAGAARHIHAKIAAGGKPAEDTLKFDPFFQDNKERAKALEPLLKKGVPPDPFDLNDVIDTYLPPRHEHPETFLP